MKIADLSPGLIVWAKIRGYPWWPGMVKREADVPADVAKSLKPNTESSQHLPILFFGTHDYALVPTDSLLPFKEHHEELKEKSLSSKFRSGVKEALEAFEKSNSSDLNVVVRRKRGRPRKIRPEDLSTTNNAGNDAKQPDYSGDRKTHLLPEYRHKLQKILLRPVIKKSEIDIGIAILKSLGRRSYTFGEIQRHRIPRVLKESLKRISSLREADHSLASALFETASRYNIKI